MLDARSCGFRLRPGDPLRVSSPQFVLSLAILAQGGPPEPEAPLRPVWIAALLALAVFAWRQVRGRRRAAPTESPPAIDLAGLAAAAPPVDQPRVLLHGTPVRLVLCALAPAGRATPLPAATLVPALVDELAPGLGAALLPHGTHVHVWPPQLSERGFARAFAAALRLPRDPQQRACWILVTGRLQSAHGGLLVGLACRAASPQRTTHVAVERDDQWRRTIEVLRA